jgi:3'-phosphoadenosine 5'-phosphosulfate (PAPS) 3'-phosphatase
MTVLSDADRAEIIATAHELAEAARVETLRHFRADGLAADTKETGHFDPVTIADRASEQAMRAILARRRPQDAIFGEEFGAQADLAKATTAGKGDLEGARAIGRAADHLGHLRRVGHRA